MTENEKMLLLQILLEDMRGSFPIDGWDDDRIVVAYNIANELGLENHSLRIGELGNNDGYRDGRCFRTSYLLGGYGEMEEMHGLEKTFHDKSPEFRKEITHFIENPEYYFSD